MVLDAMRREFGDRAWIERLYVADIRRPPTEDPFRQDTVRWLGAWLKENAEELSDADCERLRACFAASVDYTPWLCPGATKALHWCKERGLAVVLVTNTISTGDAEARRNWDRAGFAEVIDHVVTSTTVGWQKPHRAMYDRALDLAGVAASEAFMVGDDVMLDIDGAKGLRGSGCARSGSDRTDGRRPTGSPPTP